MINDNKEIEQIYVQMITESKESKFKVGDVVGTAQFHPTTGRVATQSKFKVHSIDKRTGEAQLHPVLFASQNMTADHNGNLFYSSGKSADGIVVPEKEHTELLNVQKTRRERAVDMNSIHEHIQSALNARHHFDGFSKEHADLIKSLIDKHTK